MKQLLIVISLLIGCIHISHAQQMVFVDKQYILNKMPDYKDSVAKLNQLNAIWRREIDDKQAVLDKMYVDFERDEPMLTDEVKKKRSDHLFGYERALRNLQRQRFGFDGDLAKAKQGLLQPLEYQIDSVIKVVAVKLEYKIVLDKSEGITVMFTQPNLDKTDEILKELEIK